MTRMEDIPDTAWIPLRIGYLFIGRSRSAVYQWYQDERLTTRDLGKGTEVQLGELKKLDKLMQEQRKRRPKT